jgi:hypothetical protein
MRKLYIFYHALMIGILAYFFAKTFVQLYSGVSCWSNTLFLMLITFNLWLMTIKVIIDEDKTKRNKVFIGGKIIK